MALVGKLVQGLWGATAKIHNKIVAGRLNDFGANILFLEKLFFTVTPSGLKYMDLYNDAPDVDLAVSRMPHHLQEARFV